MGGEKAGNESQEANRWLLLCGEENKVSDRKARRLATSDQRSTCIGKMRKARAWTQRAPKRTRDQSINHNAVLA